MTNKPKEINISLRDYFAAAAMQGMLGSADCQPDGGEVEYVDWEMRRRWLSRLARDSYAVADAMLKEREKVCTYSKN